MLTTEPLTSMASVGDQLPALGARTAVAHPVDDVVQPAFQEAEQVLARGTLLAVGFLVVVAELLLQHAVEATHLLLLPELYGEVFDLLTSGPAVLAGNRVCPAL